MHVEAGEGADAKNKKRKRKDGKVKLTRGADKRKKITSIFKSDVLHKLWEFQEHNDPTPFQTVAQEMGVNPSLVSKWAKSAEEVLRSAAEERKRLTFRHLPPLRKHIFRRSSKPSLWKEMETAVLQMMKTRRDEQKRIGTAWIARKGLQWLKDTWGFGCSETLLLVYESPEPQTLSLEPNTNPKPEPPNPRSSN